MIVGAGLSGVYLLHHRGKVGYKCKIFEAGSDLGGIRHWNWYPGGLFTGSSLRLLNTRSVEELNMDRGLPSVV